MTTMNIESWRYGHVVVVLATVFFLQLLPHAVAQPSNSNDRLTNPKFKPSMTVTIVVVAAACVFIAFFSFYIRRCSRDVHANGGSIRITRTRPAPRGLEASVIETFPTFLYSVVKGLKIGKGVLECAVCLNEFEDDENIRLLPKCDHVFHPECIDAWLSSHTTCPVCRADLVPGPLSEVLAQAPEGRSVEEEEEAATPVPETTEIQVVVQVQPDVIDLTQIANRPVRSKSSRKGISGRFPRSHSTGHSLVLPEENLDRFTLRLPEDIRKQILNGKLSRTMSCVVFPRQGSVSGWSAARNGSVRSGSSRGRMNPFRRGAEDGATKSGRWRFSTVSASFFWRNDSTRKGDGGGSVSAKVGGVVVGQSSASTASSRPPV